MTDITWHPIDFGKYKGLTLPEMFFAEPSWWWTAIAKGFFDARPALKSQAESMKKKLSRIRPPNDPHNSKVANYIFFDGTLDRFEVIPAGRPPHTGGSSHRTAPNINLFFAREHRHVDVVGNLKQIYFGSSDYTVSKKEAEDFFSDPANFFDD